MTKQNSYKQCLYEHYRSSFKGSHSEEDFHMVADKLAPLLVTSLSDVSRDSVVLDLGCGAGELLHAFKKCGFHKLYGCDISPEQVAVARIRFPQIEERDIFCFLQSHDSGSVDIVAAFDVVEHFSRQEFFTLLAEVKRVLRPGGVFIAHCPNGLSPFVGAVYWGDATHEWCPTPISAESMCRAAGFDRFHAFEHLGASVGLLGFARKIAWSALRLALATVCYIETGKRHEVYTRNFAFACRRT